MAAVSSPVHLAPTPSYSSPRIARAAYHPSRLSVCSPPFPNRSTTTASASNTSRTPSLSPPCASASPSSSKAGLEDAFEDGGEIGRRIGSLSLGHARPALKATPRRAQPPAPLRTTRHRRTQSMMAMPTPTYGYMLVTRRDGEVNVKQEARPMLPRRHSADALVASPTASVSSTATCSTTATTSASRSSLQRLMLVNPAIAAHLKRGGVVNVRSVDGKRSWRIKLGEQGPRVKCEEEA